MLPDLRQGAERVGRGGGRIRRSAPHGSVGSLPPRGTCLAFADPDMMKIEQILCPVDFSDTSNRALAHAVLIAGRNGAMVTILHVSPEGDEMATSERRRREDQIARLTAAAPGVVAVKFETGEVVTTIVECAANLGVDLIVMGSHGTT